MPQPNIPELEPFLRSLTLTPPTDATTYDSQIINPALPVGGVAKDGRPVNKIAPELKIWYKNVDGFTINSLINIVESTLKKQGHLSNRQIALSVIGQYLILRQPDAFSGDFLFEFLSKTVKTSVTLFYIFPDVTYRGKGTRPSPFVFGSYSFGELDLTQIRQLCKTAKSDYYERYQTYLKRRFAIQREYYDVIIINLSTYLKQRKTAFSLVTSLARLFNELTENYFDQLSHALFDRFFIGISEEQDLITAVSNAYIDEKVLEFLPFTDRISIFQNIDGKHENGFVKPLGVGGIILDFAAVDTRLPKSSKYLQHEFNLTHLTDCQIHQTIKTFARFISKAKKHKRDGYLDDSLMHFIISLDMVFGDAEQSTNSVSRRVAVLTHQRAELSYKEQVKRIRRLYGERSKYVHEGKSISVDSIDQVEEICNEVLLCLLRIQKDELRRTKIVTEKWIKDIDLIACTLEADRMPDDSLFIECGISAI